MEEKCTVIKLTCSMEKQHFYFLFLFSGNSLGSGRECCMLGISLFSRTQGMKWRVPSTSLIGSRIVLDYFSVVE